MSSAPATTNLDTVCDDEEEAAAQHTEAFLASLMFEDNTGTDDGYTSSGEGPVQITANMMSNDEFWLLHPDTTVPPSRSNDPTLSVASTPAVPVELQPKLPSANLPSIPVDSTPLSYLLAFRADLTTIEGIDLHENRIFQPGLTPSEIRRKVKLALHTDSPYPHLVNFLARDIPPSILDPHTNLVLHALLAQRDAPNLDTASRNETNRTMFQVYSDSEFLIHGNNFYSCCRPHLRNLPPQTAFELQSARSRLETMEIPPYHPIHMDVLPPPTVPTFRAENVTAMIASAPSAPLVPRAQWMKDTPPIVSEAEADATYNAACAWMFGTTEPRPVSPVTAGLKRQIAALQTTILQRHTAKTVIAENLAPTYSPTDIRHPQHHQHREFQQLRKKIVHALANKLMIREFNPRFVPATSTCPETFNRLTDLLSERDGVERALENLLDDVDSSGAPLDPKRNIEPEYQRLSTIVADLNRALFEIYVAFLPPETSTDRTASSPSRATHSRPSIPKMGPVRKSAPSPSDFEQDKYAVNATRSKANAKSNADHSADRTRARDLAKATRQRIGEQSAPYVHRTEAIPVTNSDPQYASSYSVPSQTQPEAAPAPPTRHSSRTQATKRTRYEPSAMGQGPTDLNAFMATTTRSPLNHLIVDTGASHVLFRERDTSILSNVQMSQAGSSPFALLRAANGALLSAIGRGMLNISTVTVIAYIFKDNDLVHNLLGIAPFADKGCTATFSANRFALYHLDKKPILVGTRHTGNLWRIALPNHLYPNALMPPPETGPVLLLHQTQQQPDREHVRFVHAALGSPPPTTFMKAVACGYINGLRQYPRLTTKMVRQNMPNSEATARGHLRKSPTAQPHANSDAVSARQRQHKTAALQEMLKQHYGGKKLPPLPPLDISLLPKSTILHCDYTGALPERCSSGTLYFMVSCCRSYIHLEPLSSLKGHHTASALLDTVTFFRSKGVALIKGCAHG